MSKAINTEQAQTTPEAAPRSPSAAIQDMMQTIDALRSVYAEETMALSASDTKAFFALQDRKIETAQRYHENFTEIMARRAEIAATRPDIKKLFGRKQAEFSQIAGENMEALSRMRRTVDRLGQHIMDAARNAAIRESAAYGSGGNMHRHRNKPVTMGLNESA